MKRILIVDDNFVNRSYLEEIFHDKAKCLIAVNGAEAFMAFSNAFEGKRPFDLILIDMEMPVMNGLDAVAHIREYERLAGIDVAHRVPIIAITAHEEQFTKCFEAGCDQYVLKPVNPPALVRMSNELMNRDLEE